MKFSYLRQRSELNPTRPLICRPIIPVRLLHQKQTTDLYALIDSGADASLFHAEVAQDLGLDLTAGKQQTFRGVSGHQITVYFHSISLHVIGSDKVIEIEAAFTDSTAIPAILGQIDFFMNHKIIFDRAKERIEIKLI